jgi:hypothetical protein
MGSWAAYEIGNLRASLAKREAELAAANLTIAELRRDARGDALGQAQSWRAVFTLARSLGMELGNGATTGQQDVLLFIRGLSDKLHAADSARATAEGECERMREALSRISIGIHGRRQEKATDAGLCDWEIAIAALRTQP